MQMPPLRVLEIHWFSWFSLNGVKRISYNSRKISSSETPALRWMEVQNILFESAFSCCLLSRMVIICSFLITYKKKSISWSISWRCKFRCLNFFIVIFGFCVILGGMETQLESWPRTLWHWNSRSRDSNWQTVQLASQTTPASEPTNVTIAMLLLLLLSYYFKSPCILNDYNESRVF